MDEWVTDTLTVQVSENEVDTEAFGAKMALRKLPFITQSGVEACVHFFLLAKSSRNEIDTRQTSEHSFFIYGPHSIMDLRPTIRCLNMILSYIAEPPSPAESSSQLDWGSEVKRLPVGMMTATGGPKEDWDTKGVELLEQVVKESMEKTVSCLFRMIFSSLTNSTIGFSKSTTSSI